MDYNFEIKEAFGFARKGVLSNDSEKFKTPSILVPFHKSFQYLTNISQFNIENVLTNQKEWLGSSIKDSNNIINSNYEINFEMYGERLIFIEYLNLWGVDCISNENNAQNFNEDPKFLSNILILKDNIANTGHYRYSSYENEMLKARLNAYSDILFKQIPNKCYVLEFSFSSNNDDMLSILIDWINNNREFLVGISIKNMFSNIGNYENICEWVALLKGQCSSNLLWIASGKIFPELFALAIYLGFDIIDIKSVILWGSKGLYCAEDSSKWIREIFYPSCTCSVCLNYMDGFPKKRDELEDPKFLNEIIFHNIMKSFEEINRIKNKLYFGELRTYIEKNIHNHPAHGSLLRYFDLEYGNNYNSQFPLNCIHNVICVGSESFRRPEIVNFVERIKSNIFPAKKYKMVLLLPCSAKKPYSLSKSHKKFRQIVKRVLKKYNNLSFIDIHEVILTSPLGIIPREIENVFPAAHYDIPVTGHWDQEEIEITSQCLVSWLLKYECSLEEPLIVISHLTGGYKECCKHAEQQLKTQFKIDDSIQFNYTLDDNFDASASSGIGLDQFNEQIDQIIYSNLEYLTENTTNAIKKIMNLKKHEIMLRAVLDYQFGKRTGDQFLKNGVLYAKTRNPYFNEILVYDGAGKIIVGRHYLNSGFIKLSTSGAKLLFDQGLKNQILELNDEDMKGTTVFQPILSNVDPKSHPNDEIIIVNSNGKFMGVGTLSLSGKACMKVDYGQICDVRKKSK